MGSFFGVPESTKLSQVPNLEALMTFAVWVRFAKTTFFAWGVFDNLAPSCFATASVDHPAGWPSAPCTIRPGAVAMPAWVCFPTGSREQGITVTIVRQEKLYEKVLAVRGGGERGRNRLGETPSNANALPGFQNERQHSTEGNEEHEGALPSIPFRCLQSPKTGRNLSLSQGNTACQKQILPDN